jgi:hypothetical protein
MSGDGCAESLAQSNSYLKGQSLANEAVANLRKGTESLVQVDAAIMSFLAAHPS